MDADQIRMEFSQRWSSLVGSSISRVLYYELAYEDGQPAWALAGPLFDTLDFGVEVQLTSGVSLNVMWGWELVQYGLAIREGPPDFTPAARYAMHDVSAHSRWGELLGREVEATRLLWRVSDLEPERGAYVQTAELTVAGGRHTYLSAAEYRGSPEHVWTLMDNVLVAFDEDTARIAGLLS